MKIIERDLLPKYPNVDGVVGLNHLYGCGVAINAPAAVVPIRTIHNIALNPNFGGEVMVIGLGCEKLQPERLLQGTEDVKAIPADEASIVRLQDERPWVSAQWSTISCRWLNAIWTSSTSASAKPAQRLIW